MQRRGAILDTEKLLINKLHWKPKKTGYLENARVVDELQAIAFEKKKIQPWLDVAIIKEQEGLTPETGMTFLPEGRRT